MSADAVSQIVAVLVGGLIAIAGGFLTTVSLENRRQRREALDLPTLLRVYRDLHRILQTTVALGERIEGEIETYYGARDSGL